MSKIDLQIQKQWLLDITAQITLQIKDIHWKTYSYRRIKYSSVFEAAGSSKWPESSLRYNKIERFNLSSSFCTIFPRSNSKLVWLKRVSLYFPNLASSSMRASNPRIQHKNIKLSKDDSKVNGKEKEEIFTGESDWENGSEIDIGGLFGVEEDWGASERSTDWVWGALVDWFDSAKLRSERSRHGWIQLKRWRNWGLGF